MEEIKKELAEIKGILLKLLEIRQKQFDYEFSWLNKPISGSTKSINR